MADQLHRKATELDAITPEIWSKRYYQTLLEAMVFESSVDRNYEGDIQDLGDQVNVSEFPQFDEADVLDEDEKSDADAVTVSGIPLIINKRVAKDFIITKRAIRQSLEAMDQLRDLAIHAIMKKMQNIIIDETSPDGANAISYDSGTTLALADFLEAKELKDEADVSMSDRHAILGAEQLNDLFNITGFTSSDFLLAGAPLQTGSVPPILLGYNIKHTTEVGDVSHFFHRSYQTLAIQESLNIKEFDQGVDGKRSDRINVDSLFGVKQLDGTRVVTIS